MNSNLIQVYTVTALRSMHIVNVNLCEIYKVLCTWPMIRLSTFLSVQDIEMANIACQRERKIITDYKVKVSDEKGHCHYDLA